MLTIHLRNTFAARADKLTAEMADIALRNHAATGPLDDLQWWLGRRLHVLALQKSLLATAAQTDPEALHQRYVTELDGLRREMRDRHAELLDARGASPTTVLVPSADGTRMIALDHAERTRRLECFEARLNDEMATHRRFRFGPPERHATLLVDLEQEWNVLEQLLGEVKERRDELNVPTVDSTTRIGEQLKRIRAEQLHAARHASHHEGWLLACRRGDLSAVLPVLNGLPAAERVSFVNRPGLEGLAAWHIACEAHDLPLATLLLRHGARIDLPTDLDRAPLFVAVRVDRGSRTRTFLDWLLWQGAKPKARDRSGRSALNEAAWHGNVTAMRWLVEQDLDLEEADCHRRTALHVASAAGHGPAVAWLLLQGADPHARNAAGERPIFEAARSGRDAALRAFLDAGYWLDAEERRQLSDSGMLTAPAIAQACYAPLAALLAAAAAPVPATSGSQAAGSAAQWQGELV